MAAEDQQQRREKIDKAVKHERRMEFWFSRRQPNHIDSFTTAWGEWFDDQFLEESQSIQDDLPD